MKKVIVIFTAVLFCISGIAKDTGDSWIITRDGKMDCKKISLGYNKARILLMNGEKKAIPLNTINSYTLDGKTFNQLPFYKDGIITHRMVFMELVKSFGEFDLYKLEMCDFGSWDLHEKINCYFVYKQDKMHVAVDEKSLPNICMIFGLTYSYK